MFLTLSHANRVRYTRLCSTWSAGVGRCCADNCVHAVMHEVMHAVTKLEKIRTRLRTQLWKWKKYARGYARSYETTITACITACGHSEFLSQNPASNFKILLSVRKLLRTFVEKFAKSGSWPQFFRALRARGFLQFIYELSAKILAFRIEVKVLKVRSYARSYENSKKPHEVMHAVTKVQKSRTRLCTQLRNCQKAALGYARS